MIQLLDTAAKFASDGKLQPTIQDGLESAIHKVCGGMNPENELQHSLHVLLNIEILTVGKKMEFPSVLKTGGKEK